MHKRKWLIIIATIILVSTGSFFGIQAITHTGLFKIPGKVIYAGLTAEEAAFLDNILYTDEKLNLELAYDVTITEKTSLARPEAAHELLYEIYLPTTDFYSTRNKVTKFPGMLTTMDNSDTPSSADELTDCNASTACTLIPWRDLTSKVKLLAIGDDYYLDDPSKGAIFTSFALTGESEDDIAKVEQLIEPLLASFPSSTDDFLTFAQTGVTALSRNMNAKMKTVGSGDYFSANIAPFLRSFDLTHTSNESSFTSKATSKNICSLPGFIDTLTDIGLDIVELTGNHNQDCGLDAARSTIDTYAERGIKTVGGGKNSKAAREPLLINEKGTGITMLAYNLSTGGYTLGDNPGANFYNEADAKKNIAAAKDRGDFVLIDIQFYECAAYDRPTWTTTCVKADSTAKDPTFGSESQFFRHLIDLGADMVVGTAAHQAQTYELYGDGVIYYGLGNLFFDQIWWPDTTRSLVLGHYFYNGELLQTRLYGTIYGNDYRTRLMNEEEQEWFISQLNAAR